MTVTPTHSRQYLPSWLGQLAIVTLLFGASLGPRLMTFGLFGASTSTDEYRYAVQAEEWLRRVSSAGVPIMSDFAVLYPLVPVAGGLATLVLGPDPLFAGRLLQLGISALLAPLTYVLARSGGLRPVHGLAAGILLALMPGTWDTAGLFLPDHQGAVFSILVLIGSLMGMSGRAWGWPLAGIALGLAFLSKPHLPIVLAPSLLFVLSFWIIVGPAARWSVAGALIWLTLPLALAAVAGATGIGIPRSIFLSPPVEVIQSELGDGLPGPLREQFGARSLSSYANILRGLPRPTWFAEEIGVRAVSGAVAAFIIAAVAAIFRSRASSTLERLTRFAGASVIGVLVLAQIAASSALETLAMGGILAAVVLTSFSFRPRLVNARASSCSKQATDPYGVLLVSLALLSVATIGFLALNHVGLSVTTRQFQTAMPAFAVMAGVGLVAVVTSVARLSARAPFGVVVGILAAAVALAIPGATVRRLALLALSPLIGLATHLLASRADTLRAPILGMGILVLAIVLGTPTLNTLARGRAFLGYPEDPHFEQVSGGARVATFRQAAPWLRSNIEPRAVVLTSKPYQVAYYSGLGWPGFRTMRIWNETAEARRLYLSDEALRNSRFDWIVDYNQFVLRPDSDESSKFLADFEWLASRPYLRPELVQHDAYGRLTLYALRRVS